MLVLTNLHGWPTNPLSAATGDISWLRGVDSPPLAKPRNATLIMLDELPQLSSKVFVRKMCTKAALDNTAPTVCHGRPADGDAVHHRAAPTSPAATVDLPPGYYAWASSQPLPPFWTKLMPLAGGTDGRSHASGPAPAPFDPRLLHAQLSSTATELSQCRLALARSEVINFASPSASITIRQALGSRVGARSAHYPHIAGRGWFG
jgi:hypothetical protein